MNTFASLLAATTLAAGTLATPAGAQTLASRIAAVRDGSVHLSFATRPDVCGYGDEGFSVMRGPGNAEGWRGRPCIHGPMQMELVRSDGETIGVRMCIGCRPRESSGNAVMIGDVPPAEAARYLVSAARTLSHHSAGQAMAAATVADGVDVSPELTALVKDESVSTDTRKDALFWLGQSDPSTRDLDRLYDQVASTALHEQFAFVLSQRHDDGAAIDKLIDIAQHDGSVDVRKKAMFWLGQSHDPKAVKFFRDILVR